MAKTFFIPNKESILGQQEVLTAKSILALVEGLEESFYNLPVRSGKEVWNLHLIAFSAIRIVHLEEKLRLAYNPTLDILETVKRLTEIDRIITV